jgi:hypothetical protein
MPQLLRRDGFHLRGDQVMSSGGMVISGLATIDPHLRSSRHPLVLRRHSYVSG